MGWRETAQSIARLRRPRLTQETFQRPFEIGLAVVALLSIPRVASDITAGRPLLVLVGLAALVVSHVLLAVECLRPSRLVWPTTIAAIVGMAAVVAGSISHQSGGQGLWRIDAWLGVAFAFLAFIHPRGRQLPVLAVTTLACFATVAALGHVDWRSQVLSMVFTAAPLALLALARLCVVAMIDEDIANRGARERQLHADGLSLDRAEAAASIRRETHDSLLHCLQLIAASWTPLTAAETRALCRRTLQKLDHTSPETETPPELPLDQVLRRSVVGQGCDLTWDVDSGTVLPHVAQAVSGATREAVRNVAKHCAKPEARVWARTDAEGTRVRISDDGPGFDVGAHPQGAWGLGNSVAARMASIGGAASVSSGPGGTTVSLVWPAPAGPSPKGMGRRARLWLSWTPLPMVVASLASVITSHQGMSGAAAALVWSGLALLVTVAALRVRARGLTTWQAWLLCVFAVAGNTANDLWIDPLTSNGWDLWVPSLTGALVILALPGRRIVAALAMALLVLGGSTLASLVILGEHATRVTHYGAVLAVMTHVLMTLVLVFGAASVSAYVHRTRQMEAALRRRERMAVERDRMWRQWLHRARDLAGGFLDAVASGRRDPADGGSRREASWLDARIRDELELWPGDAELAAGLDRMRRQGWQCRLHLDEPDAGIRRDLVDLLGKLPPGVAGQSVVVSARDGAATLTFSNPALTPGQRAAIEGWVVVDDPDFTQARVAAAPVPTG